MILLSEKAAELIPQCEEKLQEVRNLLDSRILTEEQALTAAHFFEEQVDLILSKGFQSAEDLNALLEALRILYGSLDIVFHMDHPHYQDFMRTELSYLLDMTQTAVAACFPTEVIPAYEEAALDLLLRSGLSWSFDQHDPLRYARMTKPDVLLTAGIFDLIKRLPRGASAVDDKIAIAGSTNPDSDVAVITLSEFHYQQLVAWDKSRPPKI